MKMNNKRIPTKVLVGSILHKCKVILPLSRFRWFGAKIRGLRVGGRSSCAQEGVACPWITLQPLIKQIIIYISICIKKSSAFGFWWGLFLVLFRRSTLVAWLLLLLIKIAQPVVESTNNQSSENTNIGELGSRRKISNWNTQQLHFVSFLSSLLLLLLSLPLFLSNLVFFVKLLNEFGNLILVFGRGQIVTDLTIVHSVQKWEESCRIEILALDIELNNLTSTDCTYCWVISPSHFSTATAYILFM